MKRTKKLFTLIITLAMIVNICTACQSSTHEDSGAADTSTDPTGYKVALSDIYNGNTWRQTEQACFTKAAEELKDAGIVSEYTILCADQDVTTQISQINSLILDGYDIIVICPSSTTAICDVIDDAVDAGITVITCIDGIVETDSCYQYDQNSAGTFGKGAEETCKMAEAGDKVVVSRGMVGLATEEASYNAQLEQIEAYDLDIVGEIEGQWTDSVSKEAFAQIFPSLDWDVDVVIGQGGDNLTAIELFEDQGLEPPLVLGGDRGNFLKWWANAYEKSGYECYACGASPQDSGIALNIAVDIRSGKVTIDEKVMSAIGTSITQEDLIENLDYFKNIDDDAIYFDEHDHDWIVENIYETYASSYKE